MAKNKTAVSNEQIVAVLTAGGTLAHAAEQLGISPRTLYDRMGTREFRTVYSAAKSDILRNAVQVLNGHILDSINTVSAIMKDTDTAPAVRLQAAKLLLENAERFASRLDAADSYTGDQAGDPFDTSRW